MSDQRLRALERKYRESGTVEDEAAYLRERVRVGDLTLERLELAAYCGHEGARRAAQSREQPATRARDILSAMEIHGREAVVCLAAAAARVALEEFESRYPRDARPRAAVQAADEYVHCPCDDHHLKARRMAGPAWEAAQAAHERIASQAAAACAAAAEAVWDQAPGQFTDPFDHAEAASGPENILQVFL